MIKQLITQLPFINQDDLVEFFEERAGIRQFDGNMTKEDAEHAAFTDTVAFFSYSNHLNGYNQSKEI